DILARARIDIYTDNTGTGDPNYADIGAYEFFYDLRIVVMCWIDESYWGGVYYSDSTLYNAHLGQYRNLVPSVAIVKSGCRVPPNPNLQETVPGIEPVLPEGYDPPPEISVETCSRKPNADDVEEFKDDFNDIRDGVVPDYLILIVDCSGSMTTTDIQPGYGEFKSWVEDNYLGTDIREQEFLMQDWVNEITTGIQNLLEEFLLNV
ncbi:unnamed protein product, partial [marine sediment metagenome]